MFFRSDKNELWELIDRQDRYIHFLECIIVKMMAASDDGGADDAGSGSTDEKPPSVYSKIDHTKPEFFHEYQ